MTRRADAALALALSASYFVHRDRDPALFADTVPCLDALSAHYRLGLLSNGSRLPEKVGLGRYFESVVFAQDHRVAKPDKGIFEVVERELDVGPAACVLVGDHPLNDVVGAQARRLAPPCGSTVTREGEFVPHPGCEEHPGRGRDLVWPTCRPRSTGSAGEDDDAGVGAPAHRVREGDPGPLDLTRPALPASWRTSSTTWPSAEAPSGSPLESSPPLGLTGRRPPSTVAPEFSSAAEPPGSHSPSSSHDPSSRAASVSWHSTTWRSDGPRPASS